MLCIWGSRSCWCFQSPDHPWSSVDHTLFAVSRFPHMEAIAQRYFSSWWITNMLSFLRIVALVPAELFVCLFVFSLTALVRPTIRFFPYFPYWIVPGAPAQIIPAYLWLPLHPLGFQFCSTLFLKICKLCPEYDQNIMSLFVNEDVCLIYVLVCCFPPKRLLMCSPDPSFLNKNKNKQKPQVNRRGDNIQVNNLELYLALLSPQAQYCYTHCSVWFLTFLILIYSFWVLHVSSQWLGFFPVPWLSLY